MDEEELEKAIADLKVFQQNGQRSPHKPLLILYALGQLQRGRTEIRYRDFKEPFSKILKETLPRSRSIHAEYPFWHLAADCGGALWNVADQEQVERYANNTPREASMRHNNTAAGFSGPVLTLLRNNPKLVKRIVETLLQLNFPTSLHADILSICGIDVDSDTDIADRARDPGFRREVLAAYRKRCAICGFSMLIDDRTIGLEAAHIKWHAAGGPDETRNGMALCSLHHKLFDAGAFTVTASHKITVSRYIHGEGAEIHLDRFANQSIHLPMQHADHAAVQFLDWHRREVFLGD